MIPKIIHYCWLSDDAMPDLVLRCINSWKEKLPDYELILWDKKRFDLESLTWTKQAYDAKKYAFAADYIRLYSVYTYGGIYLDTDVEVLKSFDTLLHLPYFMGWEFNDRLMEAATFGAEAGCKWFGDCLIYYEGREFFLPNGTMDMKVLPLIMKELIKSNYKIYSLYNLPESYKDNGFYLFPKDYFSPKSCYSRKVRITANTYSIHHFNATWMSPAFRFFMYVKHILYKIGVMLLGHNWRTMNRT